MIDTNTVSIMTNKTLLSYKGPFYIELISVFGINIRNFNDAYINARKKFLKSLLNFRKTFRIILKIIIWSTMSKELELENFL